MTANAPPISCYIRTLNEEKRIGAAVRAALAVAREVVVVDSGSTDGTVAAAEAAGARVTCIKSDARHGGGFQKRAGEDACRHDWVLDIDADEIVSEELARDIRALFAAGKPDAAVYRLNLVTVDPSGRVWRRSRSPRRAKLYDRRRMRMPEDGAWDQLRLPAGVGAGSLPGPLLHYAFDDIAHLARKQARAEARRVRHLGPGRHWPTAIRVRFGLPFWFLKRYVLRGLWREGGYGFLFALASAYSHWLRYAMLYERQLLLRAGSDRKD